MRKVVVITGATGTLGSRIMKYHVENNDIVVGMSRCDHKIFQYEKIYPSVHWTLGDIRNDLNGVLPNKADVVYHCAALKHVDKGEFFPSQYHAVNYQGTLNVFHHIDAGRFVFFSTDKAVLPVNFYGMTKSLAEKHLIAIKYATRRKIDIFRWGNILGSQGSVLHSIVKCLLDDVPKVKITHPDMTRFWLKIDDVIEFVTRDDHKSDDVLIHPKIKAARLTHIVSAVAEVLDIKGFEIEFTGIRPGEKLHEHLKSDHESCIRSDTAEQYTRDELMGMVGPIVLKIKESL